MPSRPSTLTVAGLATVLTACLVLYPDLAFAAALRGLHLWWFVVFPALLPFFVAGQVLMALGVVHFMGVILERGMRPLFNVPGVGAFVVAMGLASGYPIGAVLTAKLARAGDLDKAEAERLMSFCNTADPLFMSGAVAVGMFHRPALAGGIMAAHYVAALATGLVMRFHRAAGPHPRSGAESAAASVRLSGGAATGASGPPRLREPVLARAVDALVAARRKDARPLGRILGDAVRDSIETLMLVGGFIIMFAVVIDVLGRVGLVGAASTALAALLHPLGVGRPAAGSLVSGLFEITIGVQSASVAPAPLLQRVMLTNAIIAWSGLSVFAQVAAVTQGTGISMRPYVFARVVQALFAGALTFCFWNPAWSAAPAAGAVAAMAHVAARAAGPAFGTIIRRSGYLLAAACGVPAAAGAGAVALAFVRGASVVWYRPRALSRRG